MKILIRSMGFVKKYWRQLAFSGICLLITTLASLVIPRVLGQGVDTALSSGQKSALYIAGGLILGSSLIRGLSAYGNRYLNQVISQEVSYDIRNAIYSHLQKLSFAYHDQAQTGQLMSRATADIEAVRMWVGDGILTLFQTALQIIGISIILLTVNWRLAVLCLAFMPAIAWIAISTSNRLRPVWLHVQQLIASLGTTLQESMAGVRVVKAFSRQKEEGLKFGADAKRLYTEQISAAKVQAFNQALMSMLLGLPTVIVLWYGGQQVIAGTLTIGGVTQFVLYLGILAMPIRRLGMIANMISRSISAGERIFEILDTESPVKEKPDARDVGKLTGEITFENVSFSYNSSAPAIDDISFRAKPGQLIALVGGSGSGKSTLINLVSRFYDVTKGRITVDGIDIRDIKLASLRKNIGTAQQDVFLFSATIRDNIAYGIPDASLEQIKEAAKAAQIDRFIQSLPEGYNTWVGERGHTLSGGEKQRVAIARTLLINPAILILDDSTSAVDAETEHLIRLALDKLIQGRTTFVITHRLPIIKKADLILMLKDGRIEEIGTHDELMAKAGLYRQTYLSQLASTQEAMTGREV
ncbi:MAG: ABC transporter ATP-binding protein [Chloroflexi bacterium]|nr:ABC transporter ATP-binding protein [Chloroflexota bacterium]